MDELITRFTVVLNAVDWYETPNGVSFAKHGSHWYSYDITNTTLSTTDLAIRCAKEETDNNENERSWGYGE